MNRYYHVMSIGFNWWMVAIVAFVMLAVVIGKLQPAIRHGKVKPRYGDDVYFVLGIVAAVVLAVLLVKESSAGVIQLLDNYFGAVEEPFWAPLMMLPTTVVVSIIFGFIVMMIGLFASSNRRQVLNDRLEEMRRRRQRNNVRQRSQYPLQRRSMPRNRKPTPWCGVPAPRG